VPPERVERKLAAILAADVTGYSRLIGADEEGTLRRLKAHRKELIDPKIAEHQGRIVKLMGDGILIEFPSAVAALRCAVEVQRAMAERNASDAPDRRIEFRVGLHQGDIVVEDGDILGDGVNVAARLEGLAEAGGICVSQRVHEDAVGKVDVSFEDIGEQQLKNIARPVRVYRVGRDRAQTPEKVTLALPDKPSIAVLPFQNMSGDPEQEYFADGIVEDIITALSRFPSLFVIARNSTFTYKGRAVDMKQVGRELGVRYVLEGSVRKAGNRVRITGQLIDAATGTHLWADRFDGALEDIFDLQDRVTASVIGAIAPKLEQAEIERATRKPTDNLDAYDYFLRGLASLYQSLFSNREANDEALRLFNRATELDPGFASAYGWAAYCYVSRKSSGWMTTNDVAESQRLAGRAVQLGADNADALALGAQAFAFVGRDLDASATFIDRALELNPNLAKAWWCGGWIKTWLGEPEAGIVRHGRAIRLSPVDPRMPGMQEAMAHSHFFAGHYDEALALAAMALRGAPDLLPALRINAACNAIAGRLEPAQKSVARLRQLHSALRVSNLRDFLGPYRRPEDLAKYEEGLRKAGLPE
jgi:TolB-like protein/class 3 adenylate cyclase